jgi:glutaconate CoA-transferase, subunit A
MEILKEGIGHLFGDPDPDHAREFFRKKSRKMEGKLMTVKEAVQRFVHDGDYLGSGGFGSNRISTVALHEILRQGRKNMGFAGHTTTHDFQILSAGRVFNRLDASYIVGLEARGLSNVARKYLEEGNVDITDWSNYALAIRFKAAAMNVSFLPLRVLMGTDTFKYSAAKTITCPFTGDTYAAIPALYPDIAVIHVHEADIYGNARIKGITVADFDLSRASKRVIITAERIISNDEMRRDPAQTVIPFYLVDAVCEAPFGGYPSNVAYEYFSDEEHLQEWLKAEKDAETLKAFLDKNIYNCKNQFDYINLHGGIEKMMTLRKKELQYATREKTEGGKNNG